MMMNFSGLSVKARKTVRTDQTRIRNHHLVAGLPTILLKKLLIIVAIAICVFFDQTLNAGEIKSSLRIDVRLHGVDPSNSGKANTKALNALFSSVPNGSTIAFSIGTYVFDPGIVLGGKDGKSKGGIRIEGQGHGKGAGTSWRSTGKGDKQGTFFEIIASHNVDINNIAFWGNHDNGTEKTGIGTYIHRGKGYTSAIKFTNCYWRAFEIGTQVGHLTKNESNNENMDFYSCQWLGNTVGYRQYWPNALNNAMYSPLFTNNDINIWLGSTLQTGSLYLYNANFAVTGKTDIYFEKPASLYVYGARAENSPSFISDSGTFASVDFPLITLHDVMIIAKKSDVSTPMIKIATGGLVAINCHFGEYIDPVATIMNVHGSSTMTFIGCQFNNVIDNVFRQARLNSGILSFVGCRQWDGKKYIPVANNTNGSIGQLNNPIPSVNKNNTFITNNVKPMTITDFSNGSGVGQLLYVLVNDNQTKIKNNGNISLIGGVDSSPPKGGRMTFVKMDKWIEMSRSW